MVYDAAQLEALCAVCVKHDLWIIADEVYREFTYNGEALATMGMGACIILCAVALLCVA